MNENTISNEVEYPFNKEIVFRTLITVISSLPEITLNASDELTGRVVVNTKNGLFTWGEAIVISLSENTAIAIEASINAT